MKNHKKNIQLILKLGVSFLLCYWVYSKLDISILKDNLEQMNIFYLVLATLFFIASQWVSTLRLQSLLEAQGFPIEKGLNQRLYLLGMFYNFFIPGGIGGDAYKVYYLNKSYKWPIKALSSTLFMDRFLGLTALACLLVCCTIVLPFYTYFLKISFIILALFIGIFSSYFLTKKLFNRLKEAFLKGLFHSFIIQIFQVFSIYLILESLGITEHIIYYIGIFLISVILSLFSFAGIGIREYVFYQAAIYLNVEEEKSISIGLVFTLISAFISMFGIYYHLRKTALNTKNSLK